MTLRIAVIGGGHLGRIHARLLSGMDDVRVVAVTDPSDAARNLVAQQLNLPTYASHLQVVDQIDAAVVASPSDLHAEIAGELLAAGKHLLVEKPLTTNSQDAKSLAALARRENLTLQVGHVERFNPAWTAAADVVQHAKYIDATRASSFPGRCLEVGVVLDLMVHDIDLVLSLASGPLVDVQASGLSLVSEHEDLAEARLTFACGLVANLKASRVSLGASRSMQVFGPLGFAELDFSGPSVTTIAPSKSLSERTFQLTELGASGTAREVLFEKHLNGETRTIEPRNAILDELHDFVISIRSGAQPIVNGDAGADAVEVADQILRSIALRQWNGATDFQAVGPKATPAPRFGKRAA